MVSSMEIMGASVCEMASWMHWWLGACGNFVKLLPPKHHLMFERLLVSGSRVVEFLASQGTTFLTNLVLLRRDSLLDRLPSVVP